MSMFKSKEGVKTMFEEGKKYTYEEVKEIYNKGMELALEKLQNEFKENDKEGKLDGMGMLMIGLQNTIAYTELKSILFKR